MMITVTLSNGNTFKAVMCGSVRSADRDDKTGAYTYPNPADALGVDVQAAQDYQCYLSPYYGTLSRYSDLVGLVNAKSYYPRHYTNITDSNSEYLCYNPDDYINEKTCSHTTVSPDQAALDDLLNDESGQTQYEVADLAIGCSDCDKGTIPLVRYDTALGIYSEYCLREAYFDMTSDNVPCGDLGFV